MHYLTQRLLIALRDNNAFMDLSGTRAAYALSDLHNWAEILSAYEILADDVSRETFAKIIILRILSFTINKEITDTVLSIYPQNVWQEYIKQAENIAGVRDDYIDDRIETWLLKGYEYNECKASEGDFVVDAGAYTGNTVKYFAECVGENGKVFAFEPMQETFDILKENVGNIPQVELLQAGLSYKDAQINIQAQNHNGASIFEPGDTPIELRSVDSLVNEYKLKRLDFLKMDIECAEMDAIEGARQAIERFHPKMAICIYHKPNDVFNIYKRILEYNPYYNFYLKHNSNQLWETVLFCMPSKTPNKYTDCSETYAEDVCFAHIIRNLYKKSKDLVEKTDKTEQRNTLLEEQLYSLLKNLNS